MQNLQSNNYGCQELDLQTTRDINGGLIDLGFVKIDLVNTNGEINLHLTLAPIDPGFIQSDGPRPLANRIYNLLLSLGGGLLGA